jgi:nitrile hydratase beta subunit
MSRLHDMGGRLGDGPIPIPRNQNNEIEINEPTFKYKWHAKAWAITLAAGGLGEWNLDISRHFRECLPPKDYMNYSYYEKWLAGLTNLLVNKNIISADDLKEFIALVETEGTDFKPNQNLELDKRAWLVKDVAKTLGWGGPSLRETKINPQFKVGDKIRALSYSPNEDVNGGHTRLPSYVMGRIGKIVSYHGTHVLPDKNAHGNGENPMPLYTVEFKGAELWGAMAEDGEDSIYLDLWEPYLIHQNS